MAAVDALSFSESQSGGAMRWAVGIAFAVAIHGAVFVYLNRAPAPVAFESQAPVELDLLPPPEGAAQMEEAGANQTSEARPEEVPPETAEPEELPEIDSETPPPPPETETVAAEEPQELEPVEETPVTEMEIPPDLTETPPDVEAAVTLPPQDTVVAQEVVEPPKPRPTPPVAKRPERKPEPKREPPPRREIAREQPKPAERRTTASSAQQAGGRGGVSANAGAARAAAANYASRIRSLVAAQHRCTPGVNGRSVVRFTVNRAGRLTSVSASGGGAMATQAQGEVRRASGGFPAMPAEMTNSSATYSVSISSTNC